MSVNRNPGFAGGAIIYAKEISPGVFLLFVNEAADAPYMLAMIAAYGGMERIGTREPEQLMFFLSIFRKEDLRFFGKWLSLEPMEVPESLVFSEN
jgi:hypothetical protein